MPKLKQDVQPLLDRAISSLTLAVEIFNRPTNLAREHSVLIMLQHSFEMLLKAAILQRTGKIREKSDKYTYSFDHCLAIAEQEIEIISSDERATLSILDAQRDQAQHFYSQVSEDFLYVHAQSSVTLFDRMLKKVFGIHLADRIPSRVLPISTRPPTDLTILFDQELNQIDGLLTPHKRKSAEAEARLRTVLAFVAGSRQKPERISEKQIEAAILKRRQGNDWQVILPEVAQLRIATEGSGIPITMRISKDAPMAVRVVKPGEDTEVVGTLIKQEINVWDVYNLGLHQVAQKLGLTPPKTLALIYELGIQDDAQCYKELKKGSQLFKGYSKVALDKLRAASSSDSLVESAWLKRKAQLTQRAIQRKNR
jgi:hypothetical protein